MTIKVKGEAFRHVYGFIVPSGWRRHRHAIWIGLFCMGLIIWMCVPVTHKSRSTKVPDSPPQRGNVLNDNVTWLSFQRGIRVRRPLLIQINKDHPWFKQAQHVANDPALGSGHAALKRHDVLVNAHRLKAPMEVFHQSILQESSTLSANHPVLIQKNKPYLLIAGEVIDATIESAVSTDLSGQVRAMVSQPVYAYTGRRVLIPIGSRVLGVYQTVRHEQQERIWIRWQRVVLPDGHSVWLDSPSMDEMGKTGALADQVNHHAWSRFREAALLSLLSSGALLAGGLNASTETAGQEFRTSLADRLADAGQQSWASHASLRATALLKPGHRVKIYVMHDIDCHAIYQAQR